MWRYTFRKHSLKNLSLSYIFLTVTIFQCCDHCVKCPDTEFFQVRVFPHPEWIRTDTSYLFVFSPNAGKYGPEKALHLDTFHVVHIVQRQSVSKLRLICHLKHYLGLLRRKRFINAPPWLNRVLHIFWDSDLVLQKQLLPEVFCKNRCS